MKTLIRKERNQTGFTLIELIIAVAITSVVLAAAAGTVYQLLAGNSHNSNAMLATRNVQQAGHWISQDILMAQEVIIDNDPDSYEEFRVSWTEIISWKSEPDYSKNPPAQGVFNLIKQHRTIYTLSEGVLLRIKEETDEYSEGEETIPDFSTMSNTQISRFITELTLSGNYTLEITAYVPGFRPGEAYRVYEIESRPD
jgi:prepilin-type N-terminal cleavage/methylation domain-containing protein